MHIPYTLEVFWWRLTARPARARQVYWGLFCAAGLLASISLLGFLEQFRGRPAMVAQLSRVLCGPALWLYRRTDWLHGLIWEDLMIYSAGQWVLIWALGCPVVAVLRKVPVRLVATAVVVLSAAVGVFAAKAPSDPLQDLYKIGPSIKELQEHSGQRLYAPTERDGSSP